MRMRGKIQQNVFTNVGSEIDQLRAAELVVDGEGRHFDVEPERLQAPHAFQFHWLDEMACYPERAFRDSQIERVTQRPGAADAFRGELGNRTFLLAFEMETIGLDVAEVDFHKKMRNDE